MIWKKPYANQYWVDKKDLTGKVVTAMVHTAQGTFEEPVRVSSISLNPHHERSATTGDLVLDLVYVVVLARLGEVLRETMAKGMAEFNELGTFFGLFIPLWFPWLTTQK